MRFLARELKTPVIDETFAALGDQAREEGWSHEEYLAAVLGRQVASRAVNGTRMRIARRTSPRSRPWRTSPLSICPPRPRDVIAHLATTTFVARRRTLSCSARRARGRPTWLSPWRSRPPRRPTRSRSTPRPTWITRLADAHAHGRLTAELRRLNRYPGPGHRRGRVPALRHRLGVLVLPARRLPLRNRIGRADLKPGVLTLGRDPRRRRRRRRHHRPPRPPRTRHRTGR